MELEEIIKKLKSIKRYNLCNYIINEFAIETDKEESVDGEYIDAYDIDILIKELEK